MSKKLAKLMMAEPINTKVQANTDAQELHLYGVVGDSWDGFTLESVRAATQGMDKDHLNIRINSYGGDATEGVAIGNYLKNTFSYIEVYVDGIAASAASVIALCGNELMMEIGSILMVHNPWTFFVGNRLDLVREMKTLEAMEASYRDIYMQFFNGTEDELTKLMDDETWLTAKEAYELGFASEVINEEAIEPVHQPQPLVASLLKQYVAQAEEKSERVEEGKLSSSYVNLSNVDIDLSKLKIKMADSTEADAPADEGSDAENDNEEQGVSFLKKLSNVVTD